MAYTTPALVKAYLGISATTDDVLLGTLIAGAQAWIERKTGRVFECSVDTTRYLDAIDNVDGDTLLLPWDLCAITSITSGGIAVASSQYVTQPRHATPWYALRLKTTATSTWTYTTGPEDAIAILGRWAYSLSAPEDIMQACKRLASYLYRQKDASTYDTIAQPDMGIITVPQGMPKDVSLLLASYGRQT